MRLKLLAIPAFLFINTCVHGAIDVPVQADTIAHAIQTATATPNSVITISSNITESAVAPGTVNTSLTINATKRGIVWTGDGGTQFTMGLATGPVSLVGFTMNHTSGTGMCVVWPALGVGGSLVLDRMIFVRNNAANTSSVIDVAALALLTEGQFVMNTCAVIGAATSGTTRGIIFSATTTAQDNAKFNNLSISGFAFRGLQRASTTIVKNCLIAGNGANIVNSGTAANTDITYSGIGSNLVSPGTGTVTITAAQTWVNQAGLNIFGLRPSPASVVNYSGNPTTGVTDGFDVVGNKFNSTTPSMGAIQYYCPSGMGYGCQ